MLVYPCITPIATPSRINIGLVIRRAIKKAERLEKEAYLTMGISEGQWSKAMARVPGYGIDLHKMMALPWWFWKEFLPLLCAAVMKVTIADLRGDLCNVLNDEADREGRGEDEHDAIGGARGPRRGVESAAVGRERGVGVAQ